MGSPFRPQYDDFPSIAVVTWFSCKFDFGGAAGVFSLFIFWKPSAQVVAERFLDCVGDLVLRGKSIVIGNSCLRTCPFVYWV
uniref:Uncharacterized protein n=1 Tax=Manihot esculenta TaxID=3983 RepID=A0A2C9UNG6_MANES